jgi:hypothetical protein
LVISIPDPSNNITLYLMNQPGFTDYGFTWYKDEKRVKHFISLGAKYLVLNDTSLIQKENFKYLKDFTSNPLIKYKNVVVYDLQNIKEIDIK